MSDKKTFLRNSKVMVAMTTISRVFGLIRDQLIAFLLGTTRLGDTWSIAFMLPNLFRRLIAEGAMSTAFVPLLSELTEQEREDAARHFMRAVFSLILLAAVVIVTIMILIVPIALPNLLAILAPTQDVSATAFTTLAAPTQLMFPYLIFISLAAICQGVLNVHNRFALPALTPVVLNVCIIACGFGFRHHFQSPIWGLGMGVLLGGFFQFFLQWLHLYRMGIRLLPVWNCWTRKTREAVTLWLPTTFSAGVIQINTLVSTMIAVSVLEGAAIALQSSNRLIELILGIFTAAVSTAILPMMSRQRARADHAGVSESLWHGLAIMAVITIPASLGLMVAGPSVITLLFQRGEFNQHSRDITAVALIFHAMALIPIAWYRIASQTFYAFKKVRVVVIIASIAAVINMAGCFILPRFFTPTYAHGGIALATLISSWSLFLLAVRDIHRRFRLRWPPALSQELLKMLFAAAAFLPLWFPFQYASLPTGALLFKIVASILIYASLITLLKVRVVHDFLRQKTKPVSRGS